MGFIIADILQRLFYEYVIQKPTFMPRKHMIVSDTRLKLKYSDNLTLLYF